MDIFNDALGILSIVTSGKVRHFLLVASWGEKYLEKYPKATVVQIIIPRYFYRPPR